MSSQARGQGRMRPEMQWNYLGVVKIHGPQSQKYAKGNSATFQVCQYLYWKLNFYFFQHRQTSYKLCECKFLYVLPITISPYQVQCLSNTQTRHQVLYFFVLHHECLATRHKIYNFCFKASYVIFLKLTNKAIIYMVVLKQCLPNRLSMFLTTAQVDI